MYQQSNQTQNVNNFNINQQLTTTQTSPVAYNQVSSGISSSSSTMMSTVTTPSGNLGLTHIPSSTGHINAQTFQSLIDTLSDDDSNDEIKLKSAQDLSNNFEVRLIYWFIVNHS